MRRFGIAVMIGAVLWVPTAGSSWLPADPEEVAEGVEEEFQYPPEEALTPLPSHAPEEREMLRERLEALGQLYYVKLWEARARAHGADSLVDLFVDLSAAGPGEVEIPEAEAELYEEHDPWIFETAWGLLQEQPPDWETVRSILSILSRTGEHPERERIARHVLERPIHDDLDPDHLGAIRAAYGYVQWSWPSGAADMLETLVTLPEQPRSRNLLPVAEGEPRPEALEAELAEGFRDWLSSLVYNPERAAELAARMQESTDAGAYALEGEVRALLDRLHAYVQADGGPYIPSFQRPPEEALEPLPSVDAASREERARVVDAMHQLYRVQFYEHRFGASGAELLEKYRALAMEGGVSIQNLYDFWPARQPVELTLRGEHAPWLAGALLRILNESPIDWATARKAMGVLSHTLEHPTVEQLAQRILRTPVGPDMTEEQQDTVLAALHYYLHYWPDDAPETVAALLTLPTQPSERAILPLESGVQRPTELEERFARRLRVSIAQFGVAAAYDRMAELVAQVDRDTAAGAYELDEDAERLVTNMRSTLTRRN